MYEEEGAEVDHGGGGHGGLKTTVYWENNFVQEGYL